MDILNRIIETLFAPVWGRHESGEVNIDERHMEIGSYLQESISLDEALNIMRAYGEIPRTAIDYLKEWVEKSVNSGGELWYYDTGGDSWEYLRGECGFAIVRDNKVVDFYMWMNN